MHSAVIGGPRAGRRNKKLTYEQWMARVRNIDNQLVMEVFDLMYEHYWHSEFIHMTDYFKFIASKVGTGDTTISQWMTRRCTSPNYYILQCLLEYLGYKFIIVKRVENEDAE